MNNVGDALMSAQQVAHEQLRDMILAGRFKIGQALRQEDLAKRLGLSRVPIREALNRLVAEGIVELKPRRGFYVASLSETDAEDIFEMRALLEGRAGALATEMGNEADADAIDKIVLALDEALERHASFDRYATLNRRFHERLFQSCGRKHLLHHIFLLRSAVEPAIRLLVISDRSELSRAQAEHRQIALRFRAGHSKEVAALCEEHCAYTGRTLIRRLREMHAAE